MVKITEELVRRKAEHNEKEIWSLEELSLHQENIEKIEHLQNWCRNLQILLLQSNVISKIENLGRLKNLTYLNLALNNIERVENLQGLESLEKLDLTLNFIGDLQSVSSLKENIHFKILILTGNPCTSYKYYRDYVVSVLPQMTHLDSVDVSRTERILARQEFDVKLLKIIEQEKVYQKKREEEREDTSDRSDEEGEDDDGFWNKPSKNTPEERVKIAKKAEEIRNKDSKADSKEEKRPTQLFNKDGRPLNINLAKIPFTLKDDDETGEKILDVAVYKYLDTSLIDVDLHPRHVTIKIKGKILQLAFDEDILVDKSSCQRSETTGQLVLKMPKANARTRPKKNVEESKICDDVLHLNPFASKRELLEIGPSNDKMDFSQIYREDSLRTPFQDNPDVPPLE